MWPRSLEEKNRRRNTGFVCFMNRDDAEEAMEACDETDPFNNGRLLTLRWGKNVKKVRRDKSAKTSFQKRQKEGADSNKGCKDSTASPASNVRSDELTERSISDGLAHNSGKQTSGMNSIQEVKQYDPEIHASGAIRVEIPSDQSRFHFISTTASYVAKDPEIDQRLKDEERGNSLFDFLMPGSDNDENLKEKIFYRWRVYSFCQGDTYSIWRTEPFLMFPHGRYWMPPPLDVDDVNREKAIAADKERRQRQQKEDRANRELMTGRQFERRKRRGEFGANSSELNPEELHRFDRLVKKKLSLSREAICEAMSFCFDNCVAARELSALLKEAVLDESDRVTNDMRIARLYLLSDILFNSQQPGVRNAFMYRTTIESMAVDVFRDLGSLVRSKERRSGRITVNKLRKAVSSVLGAWTEWGVYNAAFVDDLEAHFEGREVKGDATDDTNGLDANTIKSAESESSEDADDVVIHGQHGDWKEVSDELNETKEKEINLVTKHPPKAIIQNITLSQPANETQHSVVDDAHSWKEIVRNYNPGEDLDDEDLDGEDLDDEDLDGEDLDDEDFDGEDLDGEDLDGEDLDDENIDGEDIDGEDVDGEDIDAENIDEPI